MPKIKVKGQTVQTGERPQTNGRTHTCSHMNATKRIISPAMQSINIITKDPTTPKVCCYNILWNGTECSNLSQRFLITPLVIGVAD